MRFGPEKKKRAKKEKFNESGARLSPDPCGKRCRLAQTLGEG